MSSTAPCSPLSVEVTKLCKNFGPQVVLDSVSFRVKPGEIFVLMGPSGAGKSVLLRQIAGLEQPDSGKVRIAHLETVDIHRAGDRDCTVALVFQAGALFNSMTVFDNLALYLREHRGFSEVAIARKVQAALKVLSIEDAANKVPAQLSGGMRKRVAVARAIVMDPQLILYDEPTSELDPINAATVSELIATVRNETRVTSVVVSHDKALAMGIADRVGLLWEGKLRFLGRPEEIVSCDDPDVREFMNPAINVGSPRFRRLPESGHQNERQTLFDHLIK